MLIYKILRRPEWDALRAVGFTLGAPVDLADGFIHFSTAAQAPGTAAKVWIITRLDSSGRPSRIGSPIARRHCTSVKSNSVNRRTLFPAAGRNDSIRTNGVEFICQ